MMQTNILIIGASGGIARALAKAHHKPGTRIIGVSSGTSNTSGLYDEWYRCDYSEADIDRICQHLANKHQHFSNIFICNGQLHNQHFMPEKKLENLNQQQLAASFQSNTITPALWLKNLPLLLDQKQTANIVLFSARVGSISDNRVGGWYSYRMSKAALNMLVKCTAIELKRRFKLARILAFHPGTTNTSLSKPFQKNVKPDALFNPDFVAQQLCSLLEKPFLEHLYYDWNHHRVEW